MLPCYNPSVVAFLASPCALMWVITWRLQEAEERQKRFMALKSGWKKKEAALEQRTRAAETSAAAARDIVADAMARAEKATQVGCLSCVSHSTSQFLHLLRHAIGRDCECL